MNLTDMVIMPGADYQAACNAIRDKTGASDRIKSGQMAAAIHSIDSGSSSLHIGQIRGSGTKDISFVVPFKPDYVLVLATDPYACNTPNSFITFARDFRTFARIGGLETHFINSSSKYYTNSFTNKSIGSYIYYDGEKVVFEAPPALSTYVWREESLFTVAAFKYVPDGVTDEALLKQYILSLPDSGGSLTISASRLKEANVSEATFWEYAQATKQNWTITLE